MTKKSHPTQFPKMDDWLFRVLAPRDIAITFDEALTIVPDQVVVAQAVGHLVHLVVVVPQDFPFLGDVVRFSPSLEVVAVDIRIRII